MYSEAATGSTSGKLAKNKENEKPVANKKQSKKEK